MSAGHYDERSVILHHPDRALPNASSIGLAATMRAATGSAVFSGAPAMYSMIALDVNV